MHTFLLLLLAGCPAPTPADTADTAGIACGDTLMCTGAAVCVREGYEPTCENVTDTAAECPEGTTASHCGGDGHPCCCGPMPDPTFQCYEPSGCGDTPTCDCVEAACPADKACSSLISETSGMFSCDELPKP